nr:TrkH family potassium uptake protein [Candidatus Arthromitus sp. SFB-rat-Yit]
MKSFRKLYPVQILALFFVVVIIIGSFLLSLPISNNSGISTNYLDALFTATSATSVTGLVILDTGTYWSSFGTTIILLLIQIGGLGIMSFTTFGVLKYGNKISLYTSLLMKEALNVDELQGMSRMMRYVIIFVMVTELLGMILFSFVFVPKYGLSHGLYVSLFTSISAFCNAGFDIFGNFSSLTSYYNNAYVLIVCMILIILGGIGFSIITEFINYRYTRKISVTTKIVLIVTLFLIIVGALLYFIFEYDNPLTFQNMSLGEKILNSFFSSVSPRTAGFNSIDLANIRSGTVFLTCILMLIGGSPGSTAGGIKTSTVGVIILTIYHYMRNKNRTIVLGKEIPSKTINKAFILTFVALFFISTFVILISIADKGASFRSIVFEVFSAFNTVGLSFGLTPELNSIGKILLILAMYLGRVGTLTLIFAFTNTHDGPKKSNAIKYPEVKITVG